jgi:hypothetical protein
VPVERAGPDVAVVKPQDTTTTRDAMNNSVEPKQDASPGSVPALTGTSLVADHKDTTGVPCPEEKLEASKRLAARAQGQSQT